MRKRGRKNIYVNIHYQKILEKYQIEIQLEPQET